MSVHVIADTADKLSALCAMLEKQYAVTSELLDGKAVRRSEADAVVVTADLRVVENIAVLKELFGKLSHVRKRIFLIDQKSRLFIVQAYALGATRVLFNPISQAHLLAELTEGDTPETGPAEAVQGAQEAAAAGATAIASMFSAALSGKSVDIRGTKDAGGGIANSIAEDGLSNWLETVRRHHEGTYQHCLLVTGIAVDFGLSLGVARADIERLYSAAMFHDIGKARIPLAVLDKPGRLDPQERAMIETHPAAGHEVLKSNAGITPE